MNICRFCESKSVIKAGILCGKQRYKCKNCKRHFITDRRQRGIDPATKVKAFLLIKEGMSFRGVARFLGVSLSAVLKWFKEKASMIKVIADKMLRDNQREIEVLEIDELWHFTQKKEENFTSESFFRLTVKFL